MVANVLVTMFWMVKIRFFNTNLLYSNGSKQVTFLRDVTFFRFTLKQ